MPPLKVSKDDIVGDLAALGVPRGGLLFVHSSLSAIGEVLGGADAVVDALLDVLGPEGTLVVPTFTYADPHDYPDSINPNWIFDPVNTYSGMGAITNVVRKRDGALRSVHLWHSVAAIGPLAETVVTGNGKTWASAWDANSPMAWAFNNGASILMLGVPYQNLTAIHVWEVEFDVDYRETRYVTRRTPLSDGTLVPLASRVHARRDWHPGSDFNRFGERMENVGLVGLGHVGNAVARLFTAADAHEMARTMYEEDKTAFLKQGDSMTKLSYAHTISNVKGTQCVVDPAKAFPTSPATKEHAA
ncbi:MAG: AAC(3) family N-acetyltransferase [Chloroflexota bacterium]|nr:AAC(3) family N-acetyltransferase [Chloroflexota bacterium]